MKRIKLLLCLLLVLFGCVKKETSILELNDYYLSITKSSQQDDIVYFQNVSFDFENLKSIESETVERDSLYPLFVYDKENNRYLYSAKNESGDDHIYIFMMLIQMKKHILI